MAIQQSTCSQLEEWY